MMRKLKGVGDSMLGWFGLSTDNFQVQQGQGGGYSLNFVNNPKKQNAHTYVPKRILYEKL